MVVFAFKFCIWRDRRKRKIALRRLKGLMEARSPMSDQEFTSAFEQKDHEIVLKVRQRLALFYNIPEDRIYPDDNLEEDYRVPDYEPWIYPTVYTAIYPEVFEEMRGRVIQYNTRPVYTILELIEQARQFKKRYSDIL